MTKIMSKILVIVLPLICLFSILEEYFKKSTPYQLCQKSTLRSALAE